MDLDEKVTQVETLIKDFHKLKDDINGISINVKGVDGTISANGNFSLSKFDFNAWKNNGLSDEVAQKIVQGLWDNFGPFKDAIDTITGDPDKINSIKDHWAKGIPGKIGGLKGPDDPNLAKLKEHWKGAAAEKTYKVLDVEGRLLDAFKEVGAVGASVMGATGKVVDAFRNFVLQTIKDIIAFILNKIADKLKNAVVKIVSWFAPEITAVGCAIVTLVEFIQDIIRIWREVEAMVDSVRAFADSIKKTLQDADALKADVTKVLSFD